MPSGLNIHRYMSVDLRRRSFRVYVPARKWSEDRAKDGGQTVWHVAERDSKWFSPSTSSFMINYRVDDLTALLAQLRGNGVEILKGPESEENGKFAWVMDPDGNKIELWEPTMGDESKKA
jgi:predicted enzyme related to lactoylglutathione lyase